MSNDTLNIAEPVASNEGTENEGKRGAKPKPDFDVTTALQADGTAVPLDDNGKLTAVPSNWSGDYKGLKRKQFANVDLFFDWKHVQIDARIAKLQEQKAQLDEDREAAKTRKPSPKRALKRAAKLRAQLAELEKLLAAEGISIEDDEEIAA